MKRIFIDAGHGSIKDGKYVTCPDYDPKDQSTWNKMWIHEGQEPFFEGEFNRVIANYLQELIEMDDDLQAYVVHDLVSDTPLRDRVSKANKLSLNNSIYISIHADAFPSNPDEAKGCGVFVYNKSSFNSRKLAAITSNELPLDFNKRGVKEANFFVLRETNMPAILVECGFFSNLEDHNKLILEPIQKKIASSIYRSIRKYHEL